MRTRRLWAGLVSIGVGSFACLLAGCPSDPDYPPYVQGGVDPGGGGSGSSPAVDSGTEEDAGEPVEGGTIPFACFNAAALTCTVYMAGTAADKTDCTSVGGTVSSTCAPPVAPLGCCEIGGIQTCYQVGSVANQSISGGCTAAGGTFSETPLVP